VAQSGEHDQALAAERAPDLERSPAHGHGDLTFFAGRFFAYARDGGLKSRPGIRDAE
jgi:hypothetical protein